MKKTLKHISISIKNRRKELQYSQEELAFRTNLTKNTISNIERGNTDFKISNLIKIMEVLDIGFSYLDESRPN